MRRSARFSPCKKYRYTLSRIWDESLPTILFIGLNPSTADDKHDDPTVRRCIGFARDWGYGGLTLVNLFAYRCTNPTDLFDVSDPIGPLNDAWISTEQSRTARTVVAWGTHGSFQGRDERVLDSLNDVSCLGTTKHGHPRHPLYLPARTELQDFRDLPISRAA